MARGRIICHVQVGKHFADTVLRARHFLHQGLSDGETMKTMPGRPRGPTRLARALGLDRNPLRRATDRAEAWIRAGLLAIFLIAGPMAALSSGHWAYHAGTTAARVPAAPTYRVKPAALQQAPTITDLPRVGQGGRVWAGAPGEGTGSSPRTGEALDAVVTLAALAA